MARPYGDKFLRELSRTTQDTLGTELGKLCVKANIPATYAAVALESSRMSVYSWFRGRGIRENKRKLVEAFISIIKQDLKEGILPAKSVDDARVYIEGMLGVKLA